jgi:hypothetical protein
MSTIIPGTTTRTEAGVVAGLCPAVRGGAPSPHESFPFCSISRRVPVAMIFC